MSLTYLIILLAHVSGRCRPCRALSRSSTSSRWVGSWWSRRSLGGGAKVSSSEVFSGTFSSATISSSQDPPQGVLRIQCDCLLWITITNSSWSGRELGRETQGRCLHWFHRNPSCDDQSQLIRCLVFNSRTVHQKTVDSTDLVLLQGGSTPVLMLLQCGVYS